MDATHSFTEEEQARRLERVFQIFARAQEDWAVAQDQGNSTGDVERDTEVLA
jgi:hypothetical protein